MHERVIGNVRLNARLERWPLAQTFAISRGAKTEAVVIVVEVDDGEHRGRGEGVPYARYGETPETVLAALAEIGPHFGGGIERSEGRDLAWLTTAMPAGAARNALDCALWDLAAKKADRPVHELASLSPPAPRLTAFTISLGTPEAMAAEALRASAWPLLKVKLGSEDDEARLRAVRLAAPGAKLIVDVNEGWRKDDLAEYFALCRALDVALIEQPVPAHEDEILETLAHPVPLCADESAHDRTSLSRLAGKYEAVNIKLDKAGGLTEALAMVKETQKMGLAVMAGCMISTSLAVAPALLFAGNAAFVDLDAPLWLKKDRPFGLRYEGQHVFPAERSLWG